MSGSKHRLHNTETDNLISNLRGEIGEIISTWILLRDLMNVRGSLRSGDLLEDLENPQIKFLNSLCDKLEDDIIAGLSELGQKKIGRLNFYFVQEKLDDFENEIRQFHRFIKKEKFHKKRNYDISHKEIPEKWTEHKTIHIQYPTLVKGVVLALRLMKKIDTKLLGPSAKYLWQKMREKRYDTIYPAKVGYMIMPHIKLSDEQRTKIIDEETRVGKIIWETVDAKVQGEMKKVIVCKKWGAILLNRNTYLLSHDYPLHDIFEINFLPADSIHPEVLEGGD